MLPRAVLWLERRFARGHDWDMSDVLVVVPGARAGRRLLELLVERASHEPVRAMVPPEFLTAGALPEKLYSCDLAVADSLVSLLVRMAVMREISQSQPEVLGAVIPQPPEPSDFAGWLALAQDLAELQSTLAAECVRLADVPERCAQASDFSFADHERWQALASMQRAYESTLASHGLTDRDQARFAAVEQLRVSTDKSVVLLGTTDLNRVNRQMLGLLEPSRLFALIHAPQHEANNFDELGCLRTDAWVNRRVEIAPEQWRVVEQRRDQAFEIARIIGPDDRPDAINLGRKYRAREITIGLGDESAAPMTQRVLELAGVPARSGLGVGAQVSSPALMLSSIRQFLRTRRLADFADLLRHPDIEGYLRATAPPPVHESSESQVTRSVGQWLSLMDRYITDFLRGQSAGQWLGDPDTFAPLKAVYDRVIALLPEHDADRRPLHEWSSVVAQMLETIHGMRPLLRNDAKDRAIIAGLSSVAATLRSLRTLPLDFAQQQPVNLSEALGLLLQQLAQVQIPPEPGENAIEMLGWLELPLDDAPALIVTGFNEGLIPQSKNADAFLPDGVRRVLGLTDNSRRLARDAYAMTAILHSRPDVVFVAGRRGAEGEPLLPSRLLLSCDPGELPGRIERFYKQSPLAEAWSLLPTRSESRLQLIFPEPLAAPITELHVTAFADYLACPYRFYLKHVLKLRGMEDTAVELDAMRFGSLAHEVLEGLGRDAVSHTEQIEPMVRFFDHTLEQSVIKLFGDKPPAAVLVQREQLRHRLRFLALNQVRDHRAGWRILPTLVEKRLSLTLQVDGQPFSIVGKIDRVDLHPSLGYRVSDYKTGDSAKKPDAVHRKRSARDSERREWISLQLPLYRELLRVHSAVDATLLVSLGYINLCKDTDKIGFSQAPWDEQDLREAMDVAEGVIRNIRAGVFWPPADPPDFPDDFTSICCDEVPERRTLIARSRMSQGGRQA